MRLFPLHFNADRWLWLYAGKDYRRNDGLVLSVGLVPRRDLLPLSEGLKTPVGWAFELRIRSPKGYGFHRLRDGTVSFGPHTRSVLYLRTWSNATWIGEKLARNAMTWGTGWTVGQVADEMRSAR